MLAKFSDTVQETWKVFDTECNFVRKIYPNIFTERRGWQWENPFIATEVRKHFCGLLNMRDAWPQPLTIYIYNPGRSVLPLWFSLQNHRVIIHQGPTEFDKFSPPITAPRKPDICPEGMSLPPADVVIGMRHVDIFRWTADTEVRRMWKNLKDDGLFIQTMTVVKEGEIMPDTAFGKKEVEKLMAVTIHRLDKNDGFNEEDIPLGKDLTLDVRSIFGITRVKTVTAKDILTPTAAAW